MTDEQLDALLDRIHERVMSMAFREPKRECVCGWRFTCRNCVASGLTWEQTEGRNR